MKTRGRKVQLAKNEDEKQESDSEMSENEESVEEFGDELESVLELEQSDDEVEDSDSEEKVFYFNYFIHKCQTVLKRKANLVKRYGRRNYSVPKYFFPYLYETIHIKCNYT